MPTTAAISRSILSIIPGVTSSIESTPNRPASPISKVLIAYYALTAVFMLLDYGAGINIRLTFLDDQPWWRLAYYLVCFGCFALMLWRPRWTAHIAATESLLTLSLIILSTALRVVVVSDEMIEHGRGFVSVYELINFLLSGGAMYLSYIRNLQAINRR